MRDPNRIKPILETIEKVWTKWPDFRLMQMLLNCSSHKGNGQYIPDPYFIEDDDFLMRFQEIYKDK